jgi:hypothetical protein
MSTAIGIDPDRLAELEAHWVWRDEFTAPARVPWYQEHAAEIAAKRAEDPKRWSLARLKEFFGRSIPTIRKALRAASQQAHPGAAGRDAA